MSQLTRWNRPEWLSRRRWPEIDRLRDEMEKLIDRFDRDEDRPAFWSRSRWAPAADLTETDEAYVLKTEAPDMKAEDFDVSIDEGVLTVRGEKKVEEKEEKENFIRQERFQGSFSRSFRLPGAVREDRIAASYKNGVLTVTVPKAEKEPPKGRRITVQG